MKGTEHVHSWDEDYTVDIPATCTEEGSESIHCKGCSEKKNHRVIPMLNHQWNEGETIENATCTKKGKIKYTCTREGCGEIKIEEINPINHKYQHHEQAAGYMTNGEAYDKCSVCGNIANKKILPGYSTSYVKGLKLSKGKKSFTVKWKKQNKKNLKKFNGYQIKYSLNKDMSGAKTVTAGKKAKSKKIKKLKSKKKYYVEVRTYTTANGTTFYSKPVKKTVKVK